MCFASLLLNGTIANSCAEALRKSALIVGVEVKLDLSPNLGVF